MDDSDTNIPDRLRRPFHQRHANPRRVRQAIPPGEHMVKCQLPRREFDDLLFANKVQIRSLPHQLRLVVNGPGCEDLWFHQASDRDNRG